ncbi:MAG: phospholipase D-like domain-containing protein, partial [Thiobacillus sp.]
MTRSFQKYANQTDPSQMRPIQNIIKCMTTCVLMGVSASCASLPDREADTGTQKTSAVKFENAQGPVSANQSAAIFIELTNEAGNRDILKRHLAFEQEINSDSPLVTGNQLVLLKDGPATYQAMFEAIRAAQDHINLETYIFENGEIGTRFANLLLEKQAAGVQVNIIYDSVGCLTTPKEFFERLSSGGIQLLEYNPVNPANVKKQEWILNNRDHRKLLVVDGKTAFLGGINISESYSRGSSASFRRPRQNAKEALNNSLFEYGSTRSW